MIYPRWAFDLWNTRYFVLTAYPERCAPSIPGSRRSWTIRRWSILGRILPRAGRPVRPRDWAQGADFQLRRNLNPCPRAWLVHAARACAPVPAPGSGPSNPVPPVVDPRMFVELSSTEIAELTAYLPGSAPTAAEWVTIAGYGPQRVELDAPARTAGYGDPGGCLLPGLAADDRRPGCTHPQGEPHDARSGGPRGTTPPCSIRSTPTSFRIGGAITLAASAALAVLGLVFTRRPVSRGRLDAVELRSPFPVPCWLEKTLIRRRVVVARACKPWKNL